MTVSASAAAAVRERAVDQERGEQSDDDRDDDGHPGRAVLEDRGRRRCHGNMASTWAARLEAGRCCSTRWARCCASRIPAPRLRAALLRAARRGRRRGGGGARRCAPRSRFYRAHMHLGRDAASLAALRARCAEAMRPALPPAAAAAPAAALTAALLDALAFSAYPDAAPALRELRAAGARARRRLELGRLAARAARGDRAGAARRRVRRLGRARRGQAGARDLRARAGAGGRRGRRAPGTSATASRPTSRARAPPGSAPSCWSRATVRGRASRPRPAGVRCCGAWTNCPASSRAPTP